MNQMISITAGALALTLGACSPHELPQAQVAEAQGQIRAAEVVGAEEHPRAALHLELARKQIETARELAEDDELEHAKRVLERARVDAELAGALAREASAQHAAQEALEEIDELSANTLNTL